MKRIGSLWLVVLVLSCGSEPKPSDPESPPPVVTEQPPAPVQNTPPPESSPPPEGVFDPTSISQERYRDTKAEVQALIGGLNGIIRDKKYTEWIGYLSDSYFKEISIPAFLEEKTEELYKRDQLVAASQGRDPRRIQKRILGTPRDYFDNVVVPARQNDRVDDIDFISESRVKAYTVNAKGDRLRLYDLELIDNRWKIIN